MLAMAEPFPHGQGEVLHRHVVLQVHEGRAGGGERLRHPPEGRDAIGRKRLDLEGWQARPLRRRTGLRNPRPIR